MLLFHKLLGYRPGNDRCHSSSLRSRTALLPQLLVAPRNCYIHTLSEFQSKLQNQIRDKILFSPWPLVKNISQNFWKTSPFPYHIWGLCNSVDLNSKKKVVALIFLRHPIICYTALNKLISYDDQFHCSSRVKNCFLHINDSCISNHIPNYTHNCSLHAGIQ